VLAIGVGDDDVCRARAPGGSGGGELGGGDDAHTGGCQAADGDPGTCLEAGAGQGHRSATAGETFGGDKGAEDTYRLREALCNLPTSLSPGNLSQPWGLNRGFFRVAYCQARLSTTSS
jgi:hypothetical protein